MTAKLCLGMSILTLASFAALAEPAAAACHRGDSACPVVLHMRHGTSIILATGVVSGESPDFFFKFGARAHQTLKIETRGGGLKHAGIAITLPSGKSDGVEEGAPYKLPETGNYLFSVHANTMSDGPFGKFTLRLQIR